VISEKERSEVYEKLIKRTKNKLKENVTGVKGLKNKIELLTLEACRPNIEQKEKLWDMFVYKNSDLLDYEYEAYMRGFARKSQYQLLKNFFKDRFFTDFIYVKNYHSEDYAAIFFTQLNPSFVVSETILKKFVLLYKHIQPHEYKLMNLLDRGKVVFNLF
jgi:hypothetical protein